jgi:hypothetical protein
MAVLSLPKRRVRTGRATCGRSFSPLSEKANRRRSVAFCFGRATVYATDAQRESGCRLVAGTKPTSISAQNVQCGSDDRIKYLTIRRRDRFEFQDSPVTWVASAPDLCAGDKFLVAKCF